MGLRAPLKLAVISDTDLVNSNYRAYQPAMALSRRGYRVIVNRPGQPRFRMSALMKCDVVLIHRYRDTEICALAERLRAAGVGVVWDDDDDAAAIAKRLPAAHRQITCMRVDAELRNVTRLAHVVTTPSDVLASRMRSAGAVDVRVHENYLPTGVVRSLSPRRDHVTLVWLAGLEHQIDYQQLRLREVIERLLDTHEHLRVLSIGLGLGLRTDRYEHMPLVGFPDLQKVLARADLGIAPIVDIPWNQARSNVKLKEYAGAGLAWLASPVGAYRDLGARQGGRLVRDDRWYEAIAALLADSRDRRRLAKRGVKWAKGQTIEKHADLWAQTFHDAVARAQNEAGRNIG